MYLSGSDRRSRLLVVSMSLSALSGALRDALDGAVQQHLTEPGSHYPTCYSRADAP